MSEVKLFEREEVHYAFVMQPAATPQRTRSGVRQRRGLAKALKKLLVRVRTGRLKKRDKLVEAVGRLKERFPKARGFAAITVGDNHVSLSYVWNVVKFRETLARDGAHQSGQQPG